VTDLETQLRECLSRHAEAAGVPADLARATRLRSRQLSRRRSTATVVAIVPVTAAIVFGAVTLSGTSSRAPELQVRPLASSTAPRPTPAQHGPSRCNASTAANVALVGRQHFLAPGGPQTVRNLLHFLHHRFNVKLASVAWLVSGAKERFEISGSPAAAHQALFRVTVRDRQDQRRELWFVLSQHNNKLLAERARFLGCVSPPSG
jgi:hypothetical protein